MIRLQVLAALVRSALRDSILLHHDREFALHAAWNLHGLAIAADPVDVQDAETVAAPVTALDDTAVVQDPRPVQFDFN